MRTLVVEDELDLARFIKRMLHPNFSVDVAEDLQAARRLSQQHDYDLFVLDIWLPDGNAFDFWQELRQVEMVSPVLFLTGETGTALPFSFPLDQAIHCLKKPFRVQELTSLLPMYENHQKPCSSLQSVPSLAGELYYDEDKQCCIYQGKDVSLTRKELQLFIMFWRNPGRILSKAVLVNHIWQDEQNLLGNSVETHLCALRKKIHRKFFTTIKGLGYRFEAHKIAKNSAI